MCSKPALQCDIVHACCHLEMCLYCVMSSGIRWNKCALPAHDAGPSIKQYNMVTQTGQTTLARAFHIHMPAGWHATPLHATTVQPSSWRLLCPSCHAYYCHTHTVRCPQSPGGSEHAASHGPGPRSSLVPASAQLRLHRRHLFCVLLENLLPARLHGAGQRGVLHAASKMGSRRRDARARWLEDGVQRG